MGASPRKRKEMMQPCGSIGLFSRWSDEYGNSTYKR